MKSWLVWMAGVIAAVALVAGNIETIISKGAKWLGPYIIPYISPLAAISVALDADLAVAADVFVVDPADKRRVIAIDRARREQKAVLNVPANTFYTMGWQGAGLVAGGAKNILAVKGESLFRLVHTGEADGQPIVSLRQGDGDRSNLAAAEPSAQLLLSARVAQAVVGNSSIPILTGALPELDRATAIIGLFDTGTTDCARRLFFIGGRPIVGCLGSLPGLFANVITALDGGDARRLDALLGGNAAPIRNYAAQDALAIPQDTQLRQAMESLIAAPEFWIKYQASVLARYAQAADTARQIGLVSERGRLLIFDRLVNEGPGSVARAVQSYAARYPEGAPGRPDSEAARIRSLGEIFKSQLPPRPYAAFIARRIDTIVSGHGSVRGVTFDLNQLGVSDAG
jgi:hypothetical protein